MFPSPREGHAMDRRLIMAAAAMLIALGVAPAAGAASPNTLRGRAWDMRHLGPNGLEKCRAFRRVRNQTDQLQRANGGVITPRERKRLEAKLAAAKRLPPRSLTPYQCGVAL